MSDLTQNNNKTFSKCIPTLIETLKKTFDYTGRAPRFEYWNFHHYSIKKNMEPKKSVCFCTFSKTMSMKDSLREKIKNRRVQYAAAKG